MKRANAHRRAVGNEAERARKKIAKEYSIDVQLRALFCLRAPDVRYVVTNINVIIVVNQVYLVYKNYRIAIGAEICCR